MPAGSRPWHYLRANETTGHPLRHVFLDTEAFRRPTSSGEIQSWRLGVVGLWNAEKNTDAPTVLVRCETPQALWEAVSGHARARKRTVVWAHNLAYDLRIGRAFDILPALGWQLRDLNIGHKGSWCRWRQGSKSLVMVDTLTVWPCALDKLAADLGLLKEPLPDELDPIERWWARCEVDVRILDRAVREYLGWLRGADMGYWQMTGAGQSFAAWRHKFLTHKVLVHDDETATAAERRAMHAGRCEVWRWGKWSRGGVDEWDLTLAYTTAARDAELPTRLRGSGGRLSVEQFRRLAHRYALLADVTVTTETPTVPAQLDGRVVWPVGTFTTTLWDVELLAAVDDGAQVTIHRYWRYVRTPALRAWATWIIGELDRPADELPAWQRRVLKHWARALIGRFGMRHAQWAQYARAPDADAWQSTLVDTRSGATSQLMRAGRTVLQRTGYVEGFHSVPAITGYVTALVRVRLWRLMQAAGLDRVLYVDTDSLLMRGADRQKMLALAASPLGEGLRRKRSWSMVDVRAPRCLLFTDEHRISGVARDAVPAGDGTFVGEVWEGLAAALTSRSAGVVRVRRRRWRVSGTDRRRVHLRGGRTVAVRVCDLGRAHAHGDVGEAGRLVRAADDQLLSADSDLQLVSRVESGGGDQVVDHGVEVNDDGVRVVGQAG